MKGLEKHLKEIHAYLNNVIDGVIPANHQILYNLQDIFNLSPNLRIDDLVKAFSVKNNDTMLVLYLSSFIRSIVALHELINNKLAIKNHGVKKPESEKTEEIAEDSKKDKSKAKSGDKKEKSKEKN